MKILHLIYDDINNPWLGGGGAFQTYIINKHLTQRGHDITIVTGNYPGTKNVELIDGIRYLRIGSQKNYILSRLTYSIFVHKYIKKLNFDILVEDFSPYSPIIHTLFTKKPVVAIVRTHIGIHALKKYNILGTLASIYERFGIKQFQNFIANSQYISEQLQKFILNKRIVVINDCVENNLFSIDNREDDYILFLGRIDIYNKGLDVLLDVQKDISFQKNINLVIAGGGKDYDKLKLLVSEYGLLNCVRLEGKVYGEKKKQLLNNCLFVVMPSRFEAFGDVAIEAAACSKAVIGTDIPGLRDTIKDGHTGLLVEVERSEKLRMAMLRLIENKALRFELGHNGRNWAENFSVQKTVDNFEEYYLECLSS